MNSNSHCRSGGRRSGLCFRPSGTFVEFPLEDVETSIPPRFKTMVNQCPNRIDIDAFYLARKTIDPIRDSAADWVSFESIEIVITLGSSGGSPKMFA